VYVNPAGLSTPEALRQPFDELAGVLLEAADGRAVIFLQNDGNYGDYLIRYGTVRFFEDIGLRYREYDMAKLTHKQWRLERACLTGFGSGTYLSTAVAEPGPTFAKWASIKADIPPWQNCSHH